MRVLRFTPSVRAPAFPLFLLYEMTAVPKSDGSVPGPRPTPLKFSPLSVHNFLSDLSKREINRETDGSKNILLHLAEEI